MEAGAKRRKPTIEPGVDKRVFPYLYTGCEAAQDIISWYPF